MTCSRCHGPMREAEFVDPDETGLMWMKGWRCPACGHEDNPLPRHNCYLRQGASPGIHDCPRLGRGLRAAGMGSVYGTIRLTQ